jgi:type IV pilus assembly protein PilW
VNSCVHGLTLIELMISLLLGSLFSLAIVGVYLQSKQQFVIDEAMARMQENGRFSLYLLKRELTHAGFFGGSITPGEMSAEAVGTDCVGSGNWALNLQLAVELVNSFDSSIDPAPTTGDGTALSCIPHKQIEPHTDLVAVKRTAGRATVKNGEMAPGGAVKNAQWYLRIADYGEAQSWFYHKKGGLPGSDLNSSSLVDYWEFHPRIFYIRSYSSHADDGVPSLCVEALGGGRHLGAMATRCLVEGVEDMQFQFGIDSDRDGVPDRFIDSSATVKYGATVAVRIFLLLRSIEKIPGYRANKTYILGSKSLTRDDGYLRRLFTSTVNIRNPLSHSAAGPEHTP